MGTLCSVSDTPGFRVATLNYSGILRSPFEFYSEDKYKDDMALSSIFQNNMKIRFPEYNKTKFKWQIGQIDRFVQEQRYSPIYNKQVGLKKNTVKEQLIIQQEQFVEVWNNKWKLWSQDNQNASLFQPKLIQIENIRNFDWLCYLTILQHVYKKQKISQIDKFNTEPYKIFMKKMFNSNFLKQQYKIQKTVNAMRSLDVLFLQETTIKIINQFEKMTKLYYTFSNKTKCSAIIVRKDKMGTNIHQSTKNSFLEIQQKLITNNKRTVIGLLDHKTLLINLHLSSKKQKNVQQIAEFKEYTNNLLPQYPCILIGMDANSFIDEFNEKLYMFPSSIGQRTTIKMRTMMQPQINKANQLAFDSRQFLVCTHELLNTSIRIIDGCSWKDVGYLPCERHPFDHFLVSGRVQFPK